MFTEGISGGYQSYPLITSITASSPNTHPVPRLYSRSSGESDPGYPSGGGGGAYRAGHEGQHIFGSGHSQQRQQASQGNHVIEDTPFIPPRPQLHLQQASRDIVISPERHTVDHPYDHHYRGNNQSHLAEPNRNYDGDRSAHSNASVYGYPSPQRQVTHPGHVDHYPAYGEGRRIGLEHTQWSATTPQGYYRSQAHDPSQGVPVQGDSAYNPSSQPSGRPHLPHSASSSYSSGFGSQPPTAGQGGLHPRAFDSPYPDAGEYLRRQLGIPPGGPVSLYSLPDPPNGQKPPQTIPVLIKLAIYGSPSKKLTLQEIYSSLEARFDWYREHRAESAWKNSIRHNLSLNKVFRSVQKPITEPGKGKYWELDISEGEGYKRERKRRKKTNNHTPETEGDDVYMSDGDTSSRSTSGLPDDTMDLEPTREGHHVGGGPVATSATTSQPLMVHTSGSYASSSGQSSSSSASPGSAGASGRGQFNTPISPPSQSYLTQSSFGPHSRPGPSPFAHQSAQPVFGQSSLVQTSFHQHGNMRPATRPVQPPVAWPDQSASLGHMASTSTRAVGGGNTQDRGMPMQQHYMNAGEGSDPRGRRGPMHSNTGASPSKGGESYGRGAPHHRDDHYNRQGRP